MRRVLFSAIMLSVAAIPAAAADLRRPDPIPYKAPPLPALYNWSGFYFGINGGGGWGRSHFDFPGVSTGSFNLSGGTVGGTIGANYQAGAFVFGVEGDGNWSNIHGSTACPGGVFSCETRNNWLATVRGRLGYAWNTVMPYVTGGAAFGDIEATVPGIGSAKTNKAGWTVGGGVEWALTGKVTAKVEYLYVNLGNFDCGLSCGAAPTNVDFTTNLLRAGLNFRF